LNSIVLERVAVGERVIVVALIVLVVEEEGGDRAVVHGPGLGVVAIPVVPVDAVLSFVLIVCSSSFEVPDWIIKVHEGALDVTLLEDGVELVIRDEGNAGRNVVFFVSDPVDLDVEILVGAILGLGPLIHVKAGKVIVVLKVEAEHVGNVVSSIGERTVIDVIEEDISVLSSPARDVVLVGVVMLAIFCIRVVLADAIFTRSVPPHFQGAGHLGHDRAEVVGAVQAVALVLQVITDLKEARDEVVGARETRVVALHVAPEKDSEREDLEVLILSVVREDDLRRVGESPFIPKDSLGELRVLLRVFEPEESKSSLIVVFVSVLPPFISVVPVGVLVLAMSNEKIISSPSIGIRSRPGGVVVSFIAR
jgi:hypothetical protein